MFRGKDFEASSAPEGLSQSPDLQSISPATMNQDEMRMLMVYTTSYAEIKAIYDTCRVSQVLQSLLYRPFMCWFDASRNVNLDVVGG
jgi:hypothetical protein